MNSIPLIRELVPDYDPSLEEAEAEEEGWVYDVYVACSEGEEGEEEGAEGEGMGAAATRGPVIQVRLLCILVSTSSC
jgi:hypothetical protein